MSLCGHFRLNPWHSTLAILHISDSYGWRVLHRTVQVRTILPSGILTGLCWIIALLLLSSLLWPNIWQEAKGMFHFGPHLRIQPNRVGKVWHWRPPAHTWAGHGAGGECRHSLWLVPFYSDGATVWTIVCVFSRLCWPFWKHIHRHNWMFVSEVSSSPV